eukprot:5261673-Pyramimonas_sp.AAC.1
MWFSPGRRAHSCLEIRQELDGWMTTLFQHVVLVSAPRTFVSNVYKSCTDGGRFRLKSVVVVVAPRAFAARACNL